MYLYKTSLKNVITDHDYQYATQMQRIFNWYYTKIRFGLTNSSTQRFVFGKEIGEASDIEIITMMFIALPHLERYCTKVDLGKMLDDSATHLRDDIISEHFYGTNSNNAKLRRRRVISRLLFGATLALFLSIFILQINKRIEELCLTQNAWDIRFTAGLCVTILVGMLLFSYELCNGREIGDIIPIEDLSREQILDICNPHSIRNPKLVSCFLVTTIALCIWISVGKIEGEKLVNSEAELAVSIATIILAALTLVWIYGAYLSLCLSKENPNEQVKSTLFRMEQGIEIRTLRESEVNYM